MGKLYLVLATICSLSMGTGVTLVDGLDGLAGGVSALALAGLSIAALPVCAGTYFSLLTYLQIL
jgi:phospho-N-acetylmuramoyl-pentapeptide-transferase